MKELRHEQRTMARKARIKVLRGTRSNIADSDVKLEKGELLLDTDDGYLFAGLEEGVDVNNTSNILKAREVVGYVNDSSTLNSSVNPTDKQFRVGISSQDSQDELQITGSNMPVNISSSEDLHLNAKESGKKVFVNGNTSISNDGNVLRVGSAEINGSTFLAIGTGNGSIAVGNGSIVGIESIALGTDSNASDGLEPIFPNLNTSAVAIGAGSKAVSHCSTSVGVNSSASGVLGYSVALGYNASSTASGSTAIGVGALAEGALIGPYNAYATAVGYASYAYSRATAVGGAANASSNSSAFGFKSSAKREKAVALGYNANASGCYSVALGAESESLDDYTVTIGSSVIQHLRCQVQTIEALSDSRVKEDISLANTSRCLEDVNRLPVSRFKYKDFTGTHIDVHRTGFLADDVEVVFPKSVSISNEWFPELDENGDRVYEEVTLEDGTIEKKEKRFLMKDVKHIAMEMAVPTLWGAVQELSKQLEEAKKEIRELKAKK